MTRATHVLVMAKAPVPGRVKTRLCPPCSPAEAAAIAAAALADTLEAVASSGASHKVVALDGSPGPWLPPGFTVIPQRGNGFGERLAEAWSAMGPLSGGRGIQIGMDTPQVTPALLDAQLGVVDGSDRAALCPALDGGWWLIGLPGTRPDRVFAGIPMSTASTGEAQVRRLRALGLEVAIGPPLIDIDTVGDLFAVAREIPGSRVAQLGRHLSATTAGSAG